MSGNDVLLHYPSFSNKLSGLRCVYRFSICMFLWPVMLTTSIGCSPFSNNREAASCRRSCQRRSFIPGARKDYKAILGESGGTLPIPHIEKKPEEQAPNGQDSVEEVSDAKKEALAATQSELNALAGEKPAGEGKYDTSERDAERGVIRGLMEDNKSEQE